MNVSPVLLVAVLLGTACLVLETSGQPSIPGGWFNCSMTYPGVQAAYDYIFMVHRELREDDFTVDSIMCQVVSGMNYYFIAESKNLTKTGTERMFAVVYRNIRGELNLTSFYLFSIPPWPA